MANKKQFDSLSQNWSKQTTKSYSTSFSIGVRLLSKDIRQDIHNIYGFVRFADEIVDTFLEFDRDKLLMEFKSETFKGIERGISMNPIINSFQQTVRKYRIDHDLIHDFFKSMQMDLYDISYDKETYETYIYGSAEVVGLMCLQVFTKGDKAKYDELEYYAKRLGAAFQKVNFLRDMKEDFDDLGRLYFPELQWREFGDIEKQKIQEEITEDFKVAYEGIRRLDPSCKFGVYVAYKYYMSLFRKIKRTQAETIRKKRVRVPNGKKLGLLFESYVKYNMSML